jgi:hypothetical protein
MKDWFTLQTLIAFFLGVALAAMVRGAVSSVKSKVTGA